MLFRRIQISRSWHAKHLTAGLATAFALLIGSGTMASPAVAQTTTAVEHVCERIGTADIYGNVAVICSDLMDTNYGDGTHWAEVRTEALCQNSSGTVVQCANITVVNESAYSDSGGTEITPFLEQICGHAYPSCPSGRYYVTGNSAPNTPSPATCIANVWGVTLDSDPDNGDPTAIQLPESDKIIDLSVTSPNNYGTPHTSVGNC